MAQKKDLDYYLAQARRIAAHREAGAEKEIRKLYKAMVKDLQAYVADVYAKHAQDDRLTFAMLQQAGYNARFLEEVQRNINIYAPRTTKKIEQLVNETYKIAWEGMIDGVTQAGVSGLDAAFADAVAVTPEQIKAAVQNPVSGLTLKDTLEKNRKEIIYSIKQAVGIGLMNGDRYSTMARRIAQQVDGDYKKAIRIARTEAHRVREAGNHDASVEVDKELQKGTTGMRMAKKWITMKDERVRPQRRRRGRKGWSSKMGSGANHMILDGQTVLEGEDFDLKDGNKASVPGSSGVAGHDINCRCYASYEMMTDAEFFKATGRHFPGYKKDVEPLKKDEDSSTIKAELSDQAKVIIEQLKKNGVDYLEVKKHASPLSEVDIIAALGGGDRTRGSCASLGLAYIGQKGGLDVLDFRDGNSRSFFSRNFYLKEIAKLPGAKTIYETARSSVTAGNRLLKLVEKGKEYYFCCGRHAAIVRKTADDVLQYLELQTTTRNGWHAFNGNPRYTLANRFGEVKGMDCTEYMIEVDSLKDSQDLRTILGYLNTAEADQKKGVGGYAK